MQSPEVIPCLCREKMKFVNFQNLPVIINEAMKILKNTYIVIIAMLLFCGMAGNAQESGYRWGKWSEGQHNQGTGNLMDKVIDAYIDSAGNTYIFGQFGKDARLGRNGPYICPMDSIPGYINGTTHGVYLAKVDSSGNILWCKSVRGATANDPSVPWNMVVKDNRITIAFDTRIGGTTAPSRWLYFLDTLITSFGEHFYYNYDVTYFVTLDMDGNRLDMHDLRLHALDGGGYSFFAMPLAGATADSRFEIDEDGCFHLFTSSDLFIEDSLNKAYIIADGDTNRKYFLNIPTLGGHYYTPTVYFKMSSDWQLLYQHFMIDSIAGWQHHPDRLNAEFWLKFRNVVVDGGDLYVNGYFNTIEWVFTTLTDTDTFAVKIYIDSIHYLRVDNLRDFYFTPFLLKINKSGEVVWVQQIYTEAPNDKTSNYVCNGIGGLAVDENNVYTNCSPGYWRNYFFLDSAHTIPIVRHSSNFNLTTSYDKATGTPVDYYLADTLGRACHKGDIAIVGDEIITHLTFHAEPISEIFKINKYTKAETRLFPINYSTETMTKCLSVNTNGWVFRGETGGSPHVGDSIFVGNYQKACVMTFFYDSTLDMRPRPCPQVDSLWGSSASQQTANISWTSLYNHTSYELEYIPEGYSWDNATTLECTDTAVTVTLPEDRSYMFRIRGLCDGNRVATSPWSDPITVCTQVGIDEMTNLGSVEIYPNPAKGRLTVCTAVTVENIQIVNMLGQTVMTYKPTATVCQLDVTNLQRGAYILRLTSAQGIATEKVLLN